MTAPIRPTVPLNDRVAGLMNELVKAGSDANRPDVAERINAEAALWSGRTTTLVVAGETNRGKSALLNALLGLPVLATGVSTVTDTYVVVRHGAEPHALVHLQHPAEARTVTVEEARRWMTADADDTDRARVQAVEVLLDHPLLGAGLAFVDTPGVGGLEAAHGRITLSTLARADALLFVADPSAPLSEPELRFLEQASRRIDTVLLVVTKTDRYRGWRKVVADDRHLLAGRAPRFTGAPILAVSAQLKLVADQLEASGAPDPTVAEESGIAALEAEIRTRVVGRTAVLRLANLLRVADAAVADLRAGLEATVQATTTESGANEVAARCQRELDELREAAERSQLLIVDGFAELRDAVVGDFSRALRELLDRHEKSGGSDAAELSAAVQNDLRAVDTQLLESMEAEATRLAVAAAELVQAAPPNVTLDDGAAPALDLVGPAPKSASDPSLRIRLVSTVASAGTGLGLFASRIGQGPEWIAGLLGAGVLVGVASAVFNLRASRRQLDLQTLRTNLRTTLDVARAEATPVLRQRVLRLQRSIEAEVKGHVRATTRQLQTQMAEAQQLARADAVSRQQVRNAAEQRLAGLRRLEATAKGLRVEVERHASAAPVRPSAG